MESSIAGSLKNGNGLREVPHRSKKAQYGLNEPRKMDYGSRLRSQEFEI
jgi:hypothetical protein